MCNFALMKFHLNNKENLLIAGAWTLVYASAPLFIWYIDMLNEHEFNMGLVYDTWIITTIMLVLFLIHHFILVPKLFITKRYMAYAFAILLGMSAFATLMIYHEPKPFRHEKPFHMRHDGKHDTENHSVPHHPKNHDKHHNPHNSLTPPDIARMIIVLMMIGVDLGFVAWTNGQKLQQRLLLLEKQNLKQELEQLRYQINPHFFMNTLNNIHVLVDIDQEMAKRAIIELSGLMRHALYNSSESVTPLQNEIEFLRQYFSLMKLRFDNHLSLKYDLPDAPSFNIVTPPLLFATFIENAFKHGISYQTPSFINISLGVDNDKKEIHFRCENSRNITTQKNTNTEKHGIGLSNVRKRLDLQYGNDYSLIINTEDPQRFIVELTLPTVSCT